MKRVLLIQKGVFVLLLALSLGMGTAYAYSFYQPCSTGQMLYYNITDATQHYVEITCPGTPGTSGWNGYTKPTGNITLPTTVTYNSVTYTVRAIGQYAFYGCTGLTGSLAIPAYANTIGQDAFKGCTGFTGTLTIGAFTNTIGYEAFANCSGFSGSLELPGAVHTLDFYAFSGCTGFTGTLTVSAGLTTIGQGVFKNCNFSQVNYRATNCGALYSSSYKPFENCGGVLTIADNVQSIPDYMFSGAGFTGPLTIGSSVTSIGYYTFRDCSGFTSMAALPETPPTLGTNAFYGVPTSIPVYVLCASLEDYQAASGWNAFTNMQCLGYDFSAVCSTGQTLYYNIIDATNHYVEITYPGTTGSSGWDGFTQPTGSITLPSSVTYNNVTYTVTKIGNYAFYHCTGLTGSLTIPNSVTTIGARAFQGCSGFTGSLTIPNSVTSIGFYAFNHCSGFTGSLTIPNSVISIGNDAFGSCSGFTGSLIIPNSVTTIDDYAFYGCTGFTGSLTLPNSVTTIGGRAFSDCSGFTGSLTIPNSVTTIGNYAFNVCSGFTGTLTIPNSVTTIGARAFQGCSGFTGSLTIPNSVTEIGEGAFSGCSGFTSVVALPETPPTLDNYVFQNIPTSIPVYVPCVALEDYQSATGWSDFTNMKCRQTITMYEGTATSYYVPAFIFYFDDFTRSQFVIPAADLTAMKGTPISSMTFYTTSSNVPYTTVSSADVYLKEVNYTTISAYESKSSATTVYSGTFSVMSTGSGGEMTINFSTPYYYNGGNLLVGIENTQDAGFKQIYFYGQTVTGASIAGYNASSTGTIPATQRNFIPKTTFGYTPSGCSRPIDLTVTDITPVSAMLNWTGFQDSYNVRYRVAPPFYEDFEEEESFATDWTFTSMNTSNDIGAGSNAAGLHVSAAHSGTYGFRFSSYNNASDYNQYLVSPRLDVSGELNFYYKQSNNNSSETFKVGYSTTTNVLEAFTWTDLTLTQSWQEYTLQLPSNVKYIAFHYYGNYAYFVYLDDITIDANGVPIGDWIRWYGTSNTSMEIHNLNSGTHYVWQVQGNNIICSPDGLTPWSRKASFTTGSWIFINDGNWNDGSHWSAGSVPPAGSDVIIQANATVPAGYIAEANAVTLDGGSITVADGGQLRHNTGGLQVTMKKNIEPYTDANDLDYYLLAFPFPFGVEVPAAMTANEGCDFYEFDSDEPNAEWRNHKQTPISTLYITSGYLYANPESIELSLTGGTLPTGSESMINISLDYTEGSDNPYNGWALLGNPYTYNAYVYSRNSDNELVPMPLMMYDAEGELQTVYGGPVAPMQGFFVHVTETTTVCFRGTGHGYVDLGLPSGLLWATCNVGADSPEDYGDYFAWGETTPKDYYDWDTYQYCMGSYNTMTKYCNNASYGYNGFTDNLTTLLPEDDAATANWGSGWRMPTKEEWQELLDNTAVTWTQQGGVNGRLFTASNGNSLFLPAAGYRWNDVLSNVGYSGDYWSSSLYTGRPNFAWDFYFVSDYCGMYGDTRDNGFTVRPVRSPQTEHAYVDLGLPSGTKWATCNVGAYSPEEYGDYFAWGETTPKDVYNWSTYQYCNGSQNTMTKYCNNSSYGYEGFTDDLTTLLPEDDAATANWGPDWRMPTEEEWQELYNNTTVTWTTQNGVSGGLFTAANGNSLFLPAAGYRYYSSLNLAGSYGYYWSSSLYTGRPDCAWILFFFSDDCSVDGIDRNFGRSVRPVRSSGQN